MKFIKSIFFLLLTIFSFSQDKITWGEFEDQKSSLNHIFAVSETSFFTTSSRPLPPLNIDSIVSLNFYENLKNTASGEIQLKIKEKQTKLEGVKLLNEQIHVFLSIIQGDEKILYLQKYDKSCKVSGELIEFSKYTIPNKLTRKGDFSIVVSANEEFFSVIAELPGTKKENDKIIHSVYDKKLQLISKGESFLTFPSDKIKAFQSYITNEGKLFVVSKYFKFSKGLKFSTEEQLVEKIVLNEFKQNEISTFDFKLDSAAYITSFVINESKKSLEFAGVYSYLKDGNSHGFYNFTYDFENENQTSKFTEFSSAKLKSLWNRLLSSEQKIQFIYQIKNLNLLDDGSKILSFEQIYRRIDQADMNGGISAISYFYNDILSYRLSDKNELLWESKIDKYQKTKNDDGPYSSFITYTNKDKIIYLFNDNMGNYDMQGAFFQCQAAADFSLNSYGFAQVEIDILTGNQNRKLIYEKNEIGAIVKPKKSIYNSKIKGIFFNCNYNSKDNFGKL
ncbi:MAG: hypothetical protein ACK5B9_06890 [Flavobacteriia bacterium]|jgi:hypothetical protein